MTNKLKKVFNWSEIHLSEVTFYKIHTLDLHIIFDRELGVGILSIPFRCRGHLFKLECFLAFLFHHINGLGQVMTSLDVLNHDFL